METVLKYLSLVMDIRQEKKVMHTMSDIIAPVFFTMHIHAFVVQLLRYLFVTVGITGRNIRAK